MTYYQAIFSDVDGVYTPGPNSSNFSEGFWPKICASRGLTEYMREQVILYKKNEITFTELYCSVVEALKKTGITISDVERISSQVPSDIRTEEFISKAMQRSNDNLALISAGPDALVIPLAKRYKIPFYTCNKLTHHIENGFVDCEVTDLNKGEFAMRYATQMGLSNFDNTIGIGDGKEDISMLTLVSTPIAYHAIDELNEIAKSKNGIIVRGNIIHDHRKDKKRDVDLGRRICLHELAAYLFE